MADANDNDCQSPEDREAVGVSILVGGTIDDFLDEIEGGPNANQMPLPAGVALIELAAAAMAQVILNEQGRFTPKQVISDTGARCRRILRDAMDEYDHARRAHLRLVK